MSDQLRRLFGLRIVPDHPTLWWFARQHLSADLIAAVLGETVERVAGRLHGPRLVALDSTGLWPAHTSPPVGSRGVPNASGPSAAG